MKVSHSIFVLALLAGSQDAFATVKLSVGDTFSADGTTLIVKNLSYYSDCLPSGAAISYLPRSSNESMDFDTLEGLTNPGPMALTCKNRDYIIAAGAITTIYLGVMASSAVYCPVQHVRALIGGATALTGVAMFAVARMKCDAPQSLDEQKKNLCTVFQNGGVPCDPNRVEALIKQISPE